MLKLKLENFRLFNKIEFEFEKSNLIVGGNGVGKSSLIEAIYFLNFVRSYRTSNDYNLINHQATFSRVSANLVQENELSIVIGKEKNQKIAQHQGKKVPLSKFIGKLPIVIFAPELINLVSGPPILRRRYLDMILASIDPLYLNSLLKYRRLLKQRNILLLKNVNDERLFLPWEIELVKYGIEIIVKRKAFVNYMSSLINDYYNAINHKQESVITKYISTINNEENYQQILSASRPKDLRFKTTTIGPHRDELLIMVNEQPAATVCSRGEQRMLILALKRAEIDFLSIDSNKPKPIILLDDMFSELDLKHSEDLCDLISQHPTIITTTDAIKIPQRIRSKTKIFNL